MSRLYRAPLVVAAIVSAGFAASPVMAACTRLAFSVNDYGKEGPSNDAKRLLDTYISKKMAERGVAKYTTGKKDVTCELFLDFVVFDEYTCKAEASVCWDEAAKPGSQSASEAASSVKPVAVPAAPEKVKEQTAKAPAVAAPSETAKPAAAKLAPAEDHAKVGASVKTVETPAVTPSAASSSPSGNSFVASEPETEKASQDKASETTTGSVSSPVVPPMTP